MLDGTSATGGVADVDQKIGDPNRDGGDTNASMREEIARFLENAVFMNEGGRKKRKKKSRWGG